MGTSLLLDPLKSGKRDVIMFKVRPDSSKEAKALFNEIRRRGNPVMEGNFGFWKPRRTSGQNRLYWALVRIYAYEQEGAFGFEEEYHEGILLRYAPRVRSKLQRETMTEEKERHSHLYTADRLGNGETTQIIGPSDFHVHRVVSWEAGDLTAWNVWMEHKHRILFALVPKRSHSMDTTEFSKMVGGIFGELSPMTGISFDSSIAIRKYWREWAWWRGRQKIDPAAYRTIKDYTERVNYCEACFVHLEVGEGQLAHVVTHEAGGSNTDPRNRIRLCTGCHMGGSEGEPAAHRQGWEPLIEAHPHIGWIIERAYKLVGAKPPAVPRREDLQGKAEKLVRKVFAEEDKKLLEGPIPGLVHEEEKQGVKP